MNTDRRRFKIKKASVIHGLCLWAVLAASTHAEDTPRSSMRKGLKAYRAGNYTNAVEQLKKSALEFPDVGNYNLGNAHYRNSDYEAAAKAFHEALRSQSIELQAKAYFNRGCALLAQTTQLTGPEQIDKAIELAFEGMDMFEKAILLDPKDLQAKQNYERAAQLRLKLEYGHGKMLFDHAESLLAEYQAKAAQKNYLGAKKQFEHILAEIAPNHGEARQYLPKVEERLTMLKQAVEHTQRDLDLALQQIEDYQYHLAAQRLTQESDDKKYAFDIQPDLKKQYEETSQKNAQIWEIIKLDDSLNVTP